MTTQQVLAVALVNGLWQSPLIALATWLVLRAFLRTNAALRYGTWFAALIACAVFPFLTASRSSGIAAPATAVAIAEGLWALVSIALMLRIVLNIFALRQAKLTALPVAPSDRANLAGWNMKGGSLRDLRLCVSGEIESPVAVGLFDAMVLLPEWMLAGNARDLDGVINHELAHLRRYDDWTTLVQRVIEAALFFNPTVHWIARQLEVEREVACDDVAVAEAGDALAYAECLTAIARNVGWWKRSELAPSLVSARKVLSLRVERLLDSRSSQTNTPTQVAALATTAFAAVLCVSFALVPLASMAIAAPQDDPAVHARALAIYRSLQMQRDKDPRLVGGENALALIGAPATFQISDRRYTAKGSTFWYRVRTAHGQAAMQVRTDRRDAVLGFTIEARGTNAKQDPAAAYAYINTGPDLTLP